MATLSYREPLSCDDSFVISSLPAVAYPEVHVTRNLEKISPAWRLFEMTIVNQQQTCHRKSAIQYSFKFISSLLTLRFAPFPFDL